MKKSMAIVLLGLLLLVVGCGVNKDFVAQQISDSEARTDGKIGELRDKTDGNAAEVAKLKSLATELTKKTDMAINEAKGFENYQAIWQGVINFDFDSYEVNATSEQILNDAGLKLEQNPGSVIEILGHTDVTGAATYNFLLGEKRAGSTKRYLAEKFGISLYRMFIMSYGESKPISMPDERNASSTNRRVNLTIWGKL
ncbi:MAG: OmpA family protein [candidate division Zixibacteria bacterium]|nr:OmpA family protein [candidate division Zixibacteria bacterium]